MQELIDTMAPRTVDRIASLHEVADALNALVASDAETVADQCALAAVSAPLGAEAERAAAFAGRLADAGIAGARADEAGNIIAHLPCATDPAAPAVLVCAHLDTVFDGDVDIRVRREGDLLRAPGIADNARGLAGMIAIARVLVRAGVRTTRPLVLVASVGEEGAGDLRGAKHLFREGGSAREACAFIALDGSGSTQIVHRAVGSRRLRIEVCGPGGHSWMDRGAANPIHAVGRAVSAITASDAETAVALTVTRLGGGESINAVPSQAWFEVDVRSEDADAIASAERGVRSIVDRMVSRENDRPGAAALSLEILTIGDRPVGRTSPNSALVRHAIAATEHIGLEPGLIASSTDANLPMALGIPAIAMGAGGDSGGTHTRAEWYGNDGGARGLQRVLLTMLAAAGVVD